MSEFILIAIPTACFLSAAVIGIACCVVAGKADQRLEEMMREERERTT